MASTFPYPAFCSSRVSLALRISALLLMIARLSLSSFFKIAVVSCNSFFFVSFIRFSPFCIGLPSSATTLPSLSDGDSAPFRLFYFYSFSRISLIEPSMYVLPFNLSSGASAFSISLIAAPLSPVWINLSATSSINVMSMHVSPMAFPPSVITCVSYVIVIVFVLFTSCVLLFR